MNKPHDGHGPVVSGGVKGDELRAAVVSNIPLSLEFQSAWIVKPRQSCSSEMS